jgi:hypothetical protein
VPKEVVRRVRVRRGTRNSIVNLIFTIKLSSFVETTALSLGTERNLKEIKVSIHQSKYSVHFL